MPSLSVHSIHLHSNTAFSISTIQAHLLWWPSFSQHALTAVIQQSRYSIFYDRDTSIQLSLLWQSHTPVSVLPLKPQVSPILSTYI